MTHWQFVILAYAITALVLTGLFARLFIAGRRLRQELRQMEQKRAANRRNHG
ncbi:heme exporter protein CcmD [Candidatus Tokpelaia sp.]|uniref:heme exporter protein CcmD n=1 Tax=Candidatus Tokpelaia sp. TaxID=2233777 RepID=UPI00123B7CD8|nr:heme exporter protein CcmD [Candidatus Tokpelaia sp.]KAA6405389.1 heme exporter protein CcmD [Candidatus Tokpelaia sp.]